MSCISYAQLGEVAKLNPTLNSAESIPAEELVDFLPMSAVDAGCSIATPNEVRLFKDVRQGYTSFSNEDVLLAKITPCFENGKIAQALLKHKYGFGSTEFHVLRADPERLNSRYLVHFLRRDKIRLDGERKMTGSAGQRRVPKHFLESLSIPLPPLPEQIRIASILDQADALRVKRREALAQLDTLTQAIFIEMFGDPATNPKSWPYKSLIDLGNVVTGGTPPSSKPGMFEGPIPFVTPGDLESDESVKRSLTTEGAKESRTVRAGSTLVCCIGATIGKMGIARVQSAFNQQLNAVEWTGEIDDLYGYAVLRFFKPTIRTWGASTTLPILKKSSFEKIEIPVPPVPLQREFAERVKAVEKLRVAHKSSLAELDVLFASLQNLAFKGGL